MKNKIESKIAAGTAFAAGPGTSGNMGARTPGIFGTVSAINGDTLTVTSKGFGQNQSATLTTYTVDATSATVTKNGASSSLSNITVGDTIMAQGTLSGTSLVATSINDGKMMGKIGKNPSMGKGNDGNGPQTPVIQGNGEPIVGGSVTAVSGSTLTITNASNITYTVDATNAKIIEGNATSTISSIAVGDKVVVQGTVSGTSITAYSVIDQVTATANAPPHKGGLSGALESIKGFFHNLFGF